MRRWFGSLQGRLVLLVVAALLVAQVVGLVLHLIDRHEYIRELNESIATRRIPAAVGLLESLPVSQRDPLAAVLNTTWSRFAIVDRPPVVETTGFESMAAQLAGAVDPTRPGIRVGRMPGPSAVLPEPRWSGETLLIAVPLENGGGWLTMERPLRPGIHHAVGRVLFTLMLSAVAVLAAVAWLARRITRPLTALTEAADRFGRGDAVTPLPESGPADVRRTIRAFNLMSDRLQRFIADRTRMLAAISHDLRTPITALKLRSEMVDDEETRERMQRSLDEMQRMVEATLQFARAEAVQEAAESVDLGELLQDVCGDVADAGGTVRCDLPAGIRVLGRPSALARALRNLVDNAVFYGGEAHVSLTAGDAVSVCVEDPGPGIAPADRERVFEPFVRLEASRSSDTGGVGLGLATARTTIHAHGGRIRLDDSELGGLKVEVLLPPAA